MGVFMGVGILLLPRLFVIFHIFVVKLWLTTSSSAGRFWPRFISRSEPRRRNLHCSTLFPLYSRVWSVLGGEQKRQKVVEKKTERRRRGETGGPKCGIVFEMRICEKCTVANFRVVDALRSLVPCYFA